MFFPLYDENPSHRLPLVTYALVAANVVAFLWLNAQGPLRQIEVTVEHGFVPARVASLRLGRPVEIALKDLVPPGAPIDPRILARAGFRLQPRVGEVGMTLLTAMFLHGGWMHLIGNMWFLWIFGNNVEDRLGHVLYLIFYVVGGLVASGCHWLTNSQSAVPVIGASGAVAAVLGAYAVAFPRARVKTLVFLGVFLTTWDLPALLVLGFWFVGQLLEATMAGDLGLGGGVAWWAHIGGFAVGALAMLVAAPMVLARRRDWGLTSGEPEVAERLEYPWERRGGRWG